MLITLRKPGPLIVTALFMARVCAAGRVASHSSERMSGMLWWLTLPPLPTREAGTTSMFGQLEYFSVTACPSRRTELADDPSAFLTESRTFDGLRPLMCLL